MTASDAGFFGRLALVFGPLFVVGGWIASFTDVGALLIYGGVGMLVVSPALLWRSRKRDR